MKQTTPRLIPFLLITSAVLFVSTGYLLFQNQKKDQLLSQYQKPTPSPTPTIIIPKNWQTITSEIYRFSFRLPPDWREVEHSSNFQNFFPYEAPDKSQIQLIVDQTKETTLANYLAKLDQANSTSWEGQPSKKVISSIPVSVGSYPAIERKEDWLAAGFTTIATYTKIGDQVFIFNLLPYGDLPFDQTTALKNFNQILSTFRLL